MFSSITPMSIIFIFTRFIYYCIWLSEYQLSITVTAMNGRNDYSPEDVPEDVKSNDGNKYDVTRGYLIGEPDTMQVCQLNFLALPL